MAHLLGVRIKNFKALHDVALGRIAYGHGDPLPRLACFIGANGSGKSTLLDAFGFLSDCLLEGVEAACDKPWRGGFERLRTQGSTGPISMEIFFAHDDPARPIVYEFAIDATRDGVPVVIRENLRQRRKRETRGKPYYFLKLTNGKGKVWAGQDVGTDKDTRAESVRLADRNRLGLTTLGNLAEHPRIVALRSYIEHWYLSYFVPDAARRQPPAGAQKLLDREGANIGNVLQYLQRSHPKEFAAILERMRRAIPGLQKIEIETSEDRRLLLKFDEAGYRDPFFQLSMSDGTLKMLAYALLLADPSPRPLIGIEEPENGLYLELIETLARQFRSQASSEEAPTQIFATTHSPYFVDALEPSQVWVLAKDDDGRTQAKRASEIGQVNALVDQGVPLGAQWYSGHLRMTADVKREPPRRPRSGTKGTVL
jgi:predicted ATPase